VKPARPAALARRRVRGALRTLSAGALLLACAPGAFPRDAAEPRIDAARIAADVAWLADDAREGRGLGTRGLAEAARYLAEGFRAAGFEPGAGGSFFQPFEMPVAIRVAEAALEIGGRRLERGRDFEALLSSDDGELDLELVFAGYGISDAAGGYDDYAGLDVAGKAVLVLDARPKGDVVPLEGPRTGFLSRTYKLLNARNRGAAALLLAPSVADLAGLPGGAGSEVANPTLSPSGVVAVALSRSAAESLVVRGAGEDLAALQARIDAAGRPVSQPLRGMRARLRVAVERTRGEVANVVAVLPGSDPSLALESVVIGAHYDHLGHGDFGSLAPESRGEVHNGADDNASGTAGLLELARAFAAGPRPRRSLVLAAFTAEEAGLVGSARYVDALPADPEATSGTAPGAVTTGVPPARSVAMLNLDMIGRLGEGGVTVFGAESSPGFPALVEEAATGLSLPVAFEAGATGPSDQTSFHAAGTPVLFFFTGTHAEYHTPRDDAGLVNAEGEAEVLRLVQRVARRLLDAGAAPAFAATPAAPPGAPTGRGYGPYLGTVPAFGGSPVQGVRLQAVRPGSPAELAGLRAGDVIVAFAGAPVRSLEEYAALLFNARAGEPVELVVEREGRRIPLLATLGQRR
jgi:hypothetical protein